MTAHVHFHEHDGSRHAHAHEHPPVERKPYDDLGPFRKALYVGGPSSGPDLHPHSAQAKGIDHAAAR